MMENEELERAFLEAYERASNTQLQFPPDLRLHFYAYYKRATEDNTTYRLEDLDNSRLIGAFKMNALFQVQSLSRDEAKQKYIDLVNQYIPEE